ncbi:GntR family transcriptional regulator [Geobacter sp. SVR]|uniref:GntR family transcriptional regulator n=1 Tax=Geobacter sp. SVR TaxID=2495594 RepID=UPI00143EF6EA|nr:GntR family transcriptional regulator [Geobacter sp. SVR]BCS52471.1 GntR family transcriptional regulator [Geobacter sp. SVR]GCF84092.1 GntR family transcriptional regulator [Geobacter sp. SVR]
MKKPMEKHLTLREKILENIRDAIISGSLKAGSRVSEPELAERYGISRTPIREAFRQLESEGYLTVIPRRGAVVSEFSQKDVEEFYAIKSILEGYAARRACEKLTGKELDRLQAINVRLSELAEQNDIKTFFKIHSDFHDLFIKAADNDKLRELITSVVTRFQRLRLMSLSLPGRMKISVMEHEKIIEAFRKRDAEAAESLVRKNAEYGGKVLMDGKNIVISGKGLAVGGSEGLPAMASAPQIDL